jgi:ABC-type transporter MlaC component
VRQSDDGYAIIDVVAEGVSLVVSQRNEVGSIVERQGMPGLIEAMRERSEEGGAVL